MLSEESKQPRGDEECDDYKLLSEEEFDLVDSVGLDWITQAYVHSYDKYKETHKGKCNHDWCVLDPFHPGLMKHPWEVEEMIWDEQHTRKLKGRPLLEADDENANYFKESSPMRTLDYSEC